MADHTDPNRIAWIFSPGKSGATMIAKPDPAEGNDGYLNQGADIELDTTLGKQATHLIWPSGGAPTIAATVDQDLAAAVDAFANGNRGKILIRVFGKTDKTETPATAPTPAAVPASPPGNATGGAGNIGSIILIVGGLWLLFGRKSPLKKRRRGR